MAWRVEDAGGRVAQRQWFLAWVRHGRGVVWREIELMWAVLCAWFLITRNCVRSKLHTLHPFSGCLWDYLKGSLKISEASFCEAKIMPIQSPCNHHNPLHFVPITIRAGFNLGIQRGGGDLAAANGFRLRDAGGG